MFYYRVCRLCLELVSKESFEVLDDAKLTMLKFLHLNLNDDVDNDSIICLNCSEKLRLSFDFKTSCLRNSDQFNTNGNLALPNSSESTSKNDTPEMKSEEKIICRFCLNSLEEHLLKELNTEDTHLKFMFEKYLPEIDINTIAKPIMCRNCVEFLQIHFNFLMNCLNNEKEIKNDHPSEAQVNGDVVVIEQIKKIQESNCRIDSALKVEKEEFEANKQENFVKNEVDDYIEEEYQEIPEEVLGNGVLEQTKKIEEPNKSINNFEGVQRNINIVGCEPDLVKEKKEEFEKIENYEIHIKGDMDIQIEKEPQETVPESNFEPNAIEQSQQLPSTANVQNANQYLIMFPNIVPFTIPETMFKCEECMFTTSYKTVLNAHCRAIHLHKCTVCPFESEDKLMLDVHYENKHKKTVFKCQHCDFNTVQFGFFERHTEKFKRKDENETHACTMCRFETQYKCSLLTHVNKEHKFQRRPVKSTDSSRQCYKCNECQYETHQKNNLKRHILLHKKPSELKIFKCEKCSYQTRFSNNFWAHTTKRHHVDCSQAVKHKPEKN